MNLRNLLTITLCFILSIACSTEMELEWQQEEGYRWAELSPGLVGETGFEKRTPSQTNIDFRNNLDEASIADNRNLLNGSGVAAGDIDGDGLPDLYFAQLDGPNKLYKNLGNFKFSDITEQAGVAHKDHYSTGAVFSDIDGDGNLDLIVTSLEKQNALYINNGKGRFELKKESGLGEAKGSTTMALADIDGDGYLDLYITNYKKKSVKDLYDLMEITWENTVEKEKNGYSLIPPFDEHFTLIPTGDMPERRELGTKDELYINSGDGSFKKISNPGQIFLDENGDELGLERDWGLTAKFQDINNDGWPDLYVCNDFWTPDRVWINRGNGTFRAMDKLAIRNFSFSSMGVDFSDINRDGALDVFVTEMLSKAHQKRMRQAVTYSPFPDTVGEIDNRPQYMRNTLHLNRGDNSFAEIAYFSGVAASGWSWATRFMDVDLDGYEDIIINTGNAYDVQDLDTQEKLRQKIVHNRREPEGYIMEYPPLKETNKIFQNNRDLTFADKSSDWGFTETDISHGMAVADFDNDGDLDIAINRLNERAGIYENITTAPRIAVRLKGNEPNTQAVGAKIKLSGSTVIQRKEVVSGGDYVSGSEPLTVFAANGENDHYTLTVTWPDQAKSFIDSVKSNRIYEIHQPAIDSGKNEYENQGKKNAAELFADVSDRIDHTHFEKAYNDFELQPLLPIKLSQLGPGISWIDFDGDGDDDLFISSGKGGKLAVFENQGDGFFDSLDMKPLTGKAPGDLATILGWRTDGKTRILIGNSNYEQPNRKTSQVLNYIVEENQIIQGEDFFESISSTGPMAVADYNEDKFPDLFVGGRLVPGSYPMDAGSKLFKYVSGDFQIDEENSKLFDEIGLVTGAVFTDYDLDGDQDLLLSVEWDTIKLFENKNGRFQDITKSVGLEKYRGWWNGIATGDFNNDGLPDIIATNWGLNSSYQDQLQSSPHLLKLYYGDFDNDYQVEILEAYYNQDIAAYVPGRQFYELDKGLQSIRGNISSHRQFAVSSLQDILDVDLNSIPSKEINTLEHMLFINTGDGFSASPLPAEAQFSTAFSANVADFDNDGNEDLFMSQNFFALPRLKSRQDAGRGLLLRGDGSGNFQVMKGNKTGIKIFGEQRGAAISDFNDDGKTDLAVTQNGAQTKLYLNHSKKAGLSIKLVGPPENRKGIGSSVRLINENGNKGPRREIQAGSGYWSQNSAIQVMGTTGKSEFIEIIWFDGTVQKVEIVETKRSYEIHYSG